MALFDFFRGSKQERLAKRLISALREAGEARQMVYVADENVIAILDSAGARAQVAFLGNLIRELEASPESEHDAILRRYAASALDTSRDRSARDYQSVRPSLRILLKDETYPDYIALQTRIDLPDGNPARNVFELVAGDIIACCIEELDNGLRFVTEADLDSWNVSAEQALRDAKDNIAALPCEVHQSKQTYFVFADDSFQAARLVNAALFATRPARGSWVAVVPDRNTFFLAESENLEGLELLARLAEKQCEEGDRLISGTPLVMRNGAWTVFEPPETVRVPFENAVRRFATTRWNDYKAVQEANFKRDGIDVFVASLRLYENETTKAYWSDVVWSKGVDAILPVADRVVFFEDESAPLRLASWEATFRVMSEFMKRVDGLPVRYRVQTFPTAEQFVAMGAQLSNPPNQ
jgi:Protein of unknown function (DUF1444)